jgi:glycine hydroxymethyltransferase
MCKKEYEERVKNSVYPGNVASLHLQTIAATAYCLKRSKTKEFSDFTKRVVENAKSLSNYFINEGFGVFTGGTDCHIILLDLTPFKVNGEDYANELENIGISVNSKAIPFDTAPIAMGVRLGTTVLTQRGMGKSEMQKIAKIFKMVIDGDLVNAKAEVDNLVEKFPIPKEII